jgi:hypothetical protein
VMAIIASSSGSAMICWNIFATASNMLFRGELFALGVWTEWLATCCWLCLKGRGTQFSHCGGTGLCNWGRQSLLLSLCVSAWNRREGESWGDVAGREHSSCCSLGRFLRLSFSPRRSSSPSTNLQLQHDGIDVMLPFSWHFLCR